MSVSTKRTLSTVALIIGAAASLAGCGGSADAGPESASPPKPARSGAADVGSSSLSADDIYRQSVEAMAALPSMTVVWRGSNDQGPMDYTTTAAQSGACVATVHTDGDTVQMTETARGLFIKSSVHFWTHLGGMSDASPLRGKWLFLPDAEKSSSTFATFCSLKDQVAAFSPDEMLGPGTVTRGRPTTVDGKPVVTLVRTTSNATTTLYVAAEGPPYVVKTVTDDGTLPPSTTTFSHFDQPPHPAPPPSSQTVPSASLD